LLAARCLLANRRGLHSAARTPNKTAGAGVLPPEIKKAKFGHYFIIDFLFSLKTQQTNIGQTGKNSVK